jgi:acetyl-CoA acyltransferase
MANVGFATKAGADRAAIVAGLRTPFVKSGTSYKRLTALDLGKAVVAELLERTDINPKKIDRLVFGQVVMDPSTPNIAREIVLGTRLPRELEAYSVTRACATSTQALVEAAQAILLKEAEVVLCGGADSLSRPPITLSDRLIEALMAANAAKDPLGKARAFLRLKPKDFLPKTPALKELSTGLTMGESAEKMAKENGIGRLEQDTFAVRSHQRAAAGWEQGIFENEVMPIPTSSYNDLVRKDGLVRPDASLEKMADLKPAFDRKFGTITAGSSSPLTDGAAALLVMRESTAEKMGFEPLAFVKAWAFAGLDPGWQMLMGPSFATPRVLEAAGLTLDQIDLVDMHEAFAAQVLSNLKAFASSDWAKEHLNRDQAIGEIPDEKLNIYGGSISIGHPFAATGARQALTMANELKRRQSGKALVTQCAAGGMGAAVILER